MSHELSITADGRAEMFSGRGIKPWHGLGTVVSGMLTSAAALEAAHLDWRVEKRAVFADRVGGKIPGYEAIVRADTNAVLSIMTDKYHPIQNAEAFEFFDSVVGEGQAVYDTAGALHGGRRVWIMARLPKPLFIEGDELERNILLCTSHDGSSTLKMMHVTTRVVCQNTLSIALRNAKHCISILHRGNYKERVAEVQRALKISYGYFDEIGLLIGELAQSKFTGGEMRAFTEKLIPTPEGEKSTTRAEKTRAEITDLFSRGRGNSGRTKWDALQKCIRRGLADDALYWATELDLAGYTEYVWKRLRIIASEDIGPADPHAALQVRALYESWLELRKKDDKHHAPERLFLVHAILYLAAAPKSRIVDHALIVHYEGPREKREIPDFALDRHTGRGKARRRGWKHFWETGATVENPANLPDPYVAQAKEIRIDRQTEFPGFDLD